jgi:hypothetical protein
LADSCSTGDALETLLDEHEVRQQQLAQRRLGVAQRVHRPVQVEHRVIRERPHDDRQHVHLLERGQQLLVLLGVLGQVRHEEVLDGRPGGLLGPVHVGELVDARVAHLGDAGDRPAVALDRVGVHLGQQAQQRLFAGLGQADEPDVHR